MNEWSLLGLEPVDDIKSIKRAYARKIKTIDPSKSPKEFQKVREAYEYLINYGMYYVNNEYNYDDSGEQDSVCNDEVDGVDENVSETQDVFEQPLSSLEENQSSQMINIQAEGTEVNALHSENGYFDSDDIVDEFIQDLGNLYNVQSEMSLNQWISILDDDKLHYLEVNDILRFETFAFFLAIVETSNAERKSLLEMLDKLPTGIDKVIKYYAIYFDWENTELLLSQRFSHEQMQLLSTFYAKPINDSEMIDADDKVKGSGFGSFFIWFFILMVLKYVFSRV